MREAFEKAKRRILRKKGRIIFHFSISFHLTTSATALFNNKQTFRLNFSLYQEAKKQEKKSIFISHYASYYMFIFRFLSKYFLFSFHLSIHLLSCKHQEKFFIFLVKIAVTLLMYNLFFFFNTNTIFSIVHDLTTATTRREIRERNDS